MNRKWAQAPGLLALGLMLGGCVTQAPAARPDPANAAPVIPSRGLPAQELAIGECGLFLWSLSGEPTFVFFSKASSGGARMLIDERAQELRLRSTGGDVFGQFNTRQSWTAVSSGHGVDVSLEPGELLVAGQQVPMGRLVVTDREGWETIIPVSGVTACREATSDAPAPR